MRFEDILVYVEKKIKKFQQQIKEKSQQLNSNDADKFQSEVNKLLNNSNFV